MKQPEPLVVIAGAGPVGLSLALGLGRQGVRSVVLEAQPAPSPHSRAPGILPRTLEILRQWGVLDDFKAVGRWMPQLEIHLVGREQPLGLVDLTMLAEDTAVPGGLIIPQNETEALLRHAVETCGFAEVRDGHVLNNFAEHDGGVVVTVHPTSGEEAYTIEGAFLVGCDGAHSQVRQRLGWHLEGKTYPTRVMLADVRLPDARNDLPWPRLAARGRGGLGGLRIGDDLWRIVALVDTDVSDDDAVSEAAVRAQVETLFGPGPFTEVWASLFHIHCRTSPHFREGRVFLAGDAAHLNSPAFGMGMNSGIQDAHNLAWKLARAIAGGDPSLLASYEAERRPVILQNIDRFTDMATRWGLLSRPRLRSLLGRMVTQGLRHPAVMRRFVWRLAMFDHHYRHSPLISGVGPHLGERAPDREVMDGDGRFVRLYDMVGPHAVLLLFDDGSFPLWRPGQVENWVTGLPGVKVVRVLPRAAQPSLGWYWDAEGALWDAWHAEPGTAALVRPDTYVGWRAELPTQEALLRGVACGLGVARSALPVEPPALP